MAFSYLLALVVDSDLGHKALDHNLLRANKQLVALIAM